MPPSSSVDPSDRLRLRQIVIWGSFLALLVAGVALWIRYSGRILPMLDSLTDR